MAKKPAQAAPSAEQPTSDASSLPPKGFLEEEPGRKSAMRAMSFVALIASVVFGLIALTCPAANESTGIYITFIFLLAAFAPKALQKFAEKQ